MPPPVLSVGQLEPTIIRELTSEPRAEGTTHASVNPPPPSQTITPVPTDGRIGRYVVDSLLGVGGMGMVFAAHDPTLGRSVALKVIRRATDTAAAARMVREAQAMARVSHPNVIPVHDAGVDDDGRVYIAMELVDGVTLDRWLTAAPRSQAQIIEVLAAAGQGIAAAHAVGLVHRDFKPANVIVGKDGRARVLDFGLARAADGHRDEPSLEDHGLFDSGVSPDVILTVTGSLLGTPRYMSPEQWRREPADARSDQFSFAVTLYRALVGHQPFAEGTVVELREAVVSGDVRPIPSSVPPHLRALLRRALSVAAADRFPNMNALVAAMTPPASWQRRWAAITAVVTGAMMIASVVIAATWMTRPGVELGAIAAEPNEVASAPYRVRRLTARGNVRGAALSPDGQQLAVIVGTRLIVQPLDLGGEERVLLDHGVLEFGRHRPIFPAWSPDSRRVMVPTGEQGQGQRLTTIDITTNQSHTVVARGGHFAFGSGDQVVIGWANSQPLIIASGDDELRPVRSCSVPSDYNWAYQLVRDPSSDRVYLIVEHGDGTRSILYADLACTHFGTVVSHDYIRSFVVHPRDGRVFVHRATERHEVAAFDRDGRRLGSWRSIEDEVGYLAGVRGDGQLVFVNDASAWSLSAYGDDVPRELASGTVRSSFAVSPDGTQIAQVEWVAELGSLRILPIDQLSRRIRPILSRVLTASWSPDGTQVAAVRRRGRGFELVLVDPTTGTVTPQRAMEFFDPGGDLVWLDDHRIASRRSDNRTFRWIDLRGNDTGELFDATLGWTFDLKVSPQTGAMVLLWNRRGTDQGRSIWMVPPSGPPKMLLATNTDLPLPAWSHDGSKVVVAHTTSGRLTEIDPASGAERELPPVDVRGGARIDLIVPQADRLLVQTTRRSADVFAATAP